MRDPGPAVVADQAEPGEAELTHQSDLVPGYEPLGVHAACLVRLGLGRVSVAAQVSHHDGVVPGQAGGDLPPYQVGSAGSRAAAAAAGPTRRRRS